MKKATISESSNDPQVYLDYIDKEMTFCGIITTFTLACAYFMIDKLLSYDESKKTTFQINFQSPYFIATVIMLVIAAFLLFKQRADLAYYYGQISLETSSKGYTNKSIEYLFDKVDAWKFWYLYFYAIMLIICAFIEMAILLAVTMFKSCPLTIFFNSNPYSSILSILIILIGIIIRLLMNNYLLKQDGYMNLPHEKVYTRIGISKIDGAGVGIIAIANIPKDEEIFYPDEDDLIWINEDEIKDLPSNIKSLYTDFCIRIDGKYGCPSSFNRLLPAWYLNNSDKPNVYADSDYKFRALRDIKEGEELTSNYSTYSD